MEARVSVQDDFAGPGVVGGVDAAYRGDIAYIAAATVDSDARTIQVAGMTLRAEFPYVPTYFAFREMPAIEAIVKALDPRPDILLIDGHGRLHPRRFGIACHVGVALDLPTIGVAKHRLEGRVDEGDAAVRPVRLDARIEGYAWTPRGRSRPLYISPGHRISPESALAIVRMATRGKGPEPLRLADVTARKRKDSEKRETGSEA
jgi:deoxyribonuclease V